MTAPAPGLVYAHPLELFTARRLDLVVKYLFFRALAEERDVALYESLYRRHIERRTAGVEPVDFSTGQLSAKRSTDAYLHGCHTLLDSMRREGFREADAVPVAPGGALANGAHRVACALALGLRVPIRHHPQAGPAWDFAWFEQNQFSAAEISLILRHWVTLHADRTACFLLWPAVEPRWEALQNGLASIFQPVGHLDFDFTGQPHLYASVLRDIYSFGCADAHLPHIERKLEHLAPHPAKFRLWLGHHTAPGASTSEAVIKTKTHIRRLLAPHVPEEKFITCHAADTRAEVDYLAAVLLEPHNTRWFALRGATAARPEFSTWIAELKAGLARRAIPLADCCVVGSAPLDILGLRPATDLDFTLTRRHRYAHFDAGITHLTPNVDVVTAGYHRVPAPRVAVSDDQLIHDPRHHFLYRGVKFANPALICERKAYTARPKDLADVELLLPFLARTKDYLAIGA